MKDKSPRGAFATVAMKPGAPYGFKGVLIREALPKRPVKPRPHNPASPFTPRGCTKLSAGSGTHGHPLGPIRTAISTPTSLISYGHTTSRRERIVRRTTHTPTPSTLPLDHWSKKCPTPPRPPSIASSPPASLHATLCIPVGTTPAPTGTQP